MREPRVFLLAVAGFLALAVLHFATMKDTEAHGERARSDPYRLWTCEAAAGPCTPGDRRDENPGTEEETDPSGAWPEFFPGDRTTERSGQDVAGTDEELSCVRCHAAGEIHDPLFPGGG